MGELKPADEVCACGHIAVNHTSHGCNHRRCNCPGFAAVEADWSGGFPFETAEYARSFYCGMVRDGWLGGDPSEEFRVLNDALKRAVERATDGDVWGVYQEAEWHQDGSRKADRLVALVFGSDVFLKEPGGGL